MPVISKVGPKSLPIGDDAILMGFFRRHFLDRDDIAAMLFIGRDALRETAALFRGHRHHIGQQHRERLVADDLAGAPHRMAETERLLLTGEARRARRRKIGRQSLPFLELAALLQVSSSS